MSHRQNMDVPGGEEGVDAVDPTAQIVSRARPVDDDLIRIALAQDVTPLAYWETPDGQRFAGVGASHVIEGVDSPEELQRRAAEITDRIYFDGPDEARPRFIGGRAFFDNDPSSGPWREFPSSLYFLPRHLVVSGEDTTWLTVSEVNGAESEMRSRAETLPGTPPQAEELHPIPARELWMQSVARLRDDINAGIFRKVVMAHSLTVDLDRAPTAFECVERLRQANAGCFVYLLRPAADTMFVAATPERLVSRRGSEIHSGALAGSIERGETSEVDDRLSSTLRTDAKEGHEHQLVVEAIEADLQALGARVSIDDRLIRRFRSVQHLFTPVTAVHPDEPHVLELVDALHPTPAVGGLPREPVLEAIRDEETFERGWYAAPFGWFDERGDGTFAVGIRSMILDGNRARLYAGAGVVGESDPAEEWDEVQWKYRPILDTFGGT